MSRMAELLGGKTRFAILEELAESKQPMTAYSIAVARGLDPAATYRYLKEFLEFGIVESEANNKNQMLYKLSGGAGRAADDFLHSLKQSTAGVVDLEKWISSEAQAERMAKIILLDKSIKSNEPLGKSLKTTSFNKIVSKRVRGELAALVKSSQIAFKEKFIEDNGIFVLKM
jgi:DNA-binding transcriptional ArsR family regulator